MMLRLRGGTIVEFVIANVCSACLLWWRWWFVHVFTNPTCIRAFVLTYCETVKSMQVFWDAPQIEKEHDPIRYIDHAGPRVGEGGVPLPGEAESPDFRIEEPLFLARKPKFYGEEHRPYRLSPHYKQASRWHSQRSSEHIFYAGCYCTTVYKRLTPLAGCALITTRHLLTTATSTHLILRDRYHYPILDDILGAWYDTNHNAWNSSMYFSPARIHYHPLWHYPEHVNRSHPFSFTFDLSVWASTYNVFGWYLNHNSAYVCLRATSHSSWHGAPTPSNELFVVVGFQFMYAYKRNPMPWFKYGVRTFRSVDPCPKTDWGWFICIEGDWAKYGMDSGAALHRSFQGRSWKYDGLVGMCAFSMKLRSFENIHYFTILDTYPVLDFLFDAYYGYLPNVWLDKRFHDTQGYAPQLKAGYWIHRSYSLGAQYKYDLYFDK